MTAYAFFGNITFISIQNEIPKYFLRIWICTIAAFYSDTRNLRDNEAPVMFLNNKYVLIDNKLFKIIITFQ